MTLAAQTVDNDEIERFSRIAEEWWDENGKFKPLHRMGPVRLQYLRDQICAHLKRNPDQLKPLAGLSVLDIGCGGGLICEPMARMGANVTGIDASEKNIAVASLHAQKMGLAINYQHAAAETLAEQKKNFDIVLALEIVEHVADVAVFLSACATLVKPGGLLFVSTLNRTVKSYALAIVGAEYVMRWLPRGTHTWKKFLRPSEICAPLRQQDMDILHMTGMTFMPLKNSWQLSDSDLDVNYMLVAAKSRPSA